MVKVLDEEFPFPFLGIAKTIIKTKFQLKTTLKLQLQQLQERIA